jgi:formate dehydrogenase beta subunit
MVDALPYDPGTEDAAARIAEAARAIEAHPRVKTALLPALLDAQHALAWLPRTAIERVAAWVRVPVSEVYATATAYSELRLAPPDPATWHVCTGVSCDLAGADALLAASPERTARIDCQFLCALAPVVADPRERLLGRMTPDSLRERVAARGTEVHR